MPSFATRLSVIALTLGAALFAQQAPAPAKIPTEPQPVGTLPYSTTNGPTEYIVVQVGDGGSGPYKSVLVGDPTLKMDGQAVFKLAVGVLEKVARSVLEKAGKTDADIDWLIPHQANIRIMQGTAKKLKMDLNKLIVTVDEHGNTSAASVPLALDAAVRSGRVQRGDIVMLEGVGGGFTWGAALLNY